MMPASVRGEKRRKRKPVPRETCALCGRTGRRGFITRGGLRVCWAVPRCMERTLAEPPPPPLADRITELEAAIRRLRMAQNPLLLPVIQFPRY